MKKVMWQKQKEAVKIEKMLVYSSGFKDGERGYEPRLQGMLL